MYLGLIVSKSTVEITKELGPHKNGTGDEGRNGGGKISNYKKISYREWTSERQLSTVETMIDELIGYKRVKVP